MGGMGGGALGGAAGLGANDLASPVPQAAAPKGSSMGLPVPGGF